MTPIGNPFLHMYPVITVAGESFHWPEPVDVYLANLHTYFTTNIRGFVDCRYPAVVLSKCLLQLGGMAGEW